MKSCEGKRNEISREKNVYVGSIGRVMGNRKPHQFLTRNLKIPFMVLLPCVLYHLRPRYFCCGNIPSLHSFLCYHILSSVSLFLYTFVGSPVSTWGMGTVDGGPRGMVIKEDWLWYCDRKADCCIFGDTLLIGCFVPLLPPFSSFY
jgi:hypothetical protein